LKGLQKSLKPLECILGPGEVIFVPSGWWHQVLNLDITVAVTQNFCSPRTFTMAYHDMKRRKSKSLLKAFQLSLQSSRYSHLLQQVEYQKSETTNGNGKISNNSESSDSSGSESD